MLNKLAVEAGMMEGNTVKIETIKASARRLSTKRCTMKSDEATRAEPFERKKL